MPGTTGQGTGIRAAGSRAAAAAPSATVVLARERRDEVEVLLVKRHGRTAFGASHVFPGGLVGAEDRAVHARCANVSGREAAGCLGLTEGALDYYSAAIRELFEETGVLLARDADARFPSPDPAREGEMFPAERRALLSGGISWPAFLDAHGLRLAADHLTYFAWWVTPVVRAARFSTRFFLAVLPPGQVARHDGRELTDSRWMTAAAALAAARRGDVSLPPPTFATLRDLRALDGLAALKAWAEERSAAGVPRILPVIERRDGQERIVLPGEPGYPADGGERL